MTSYVFQAFTCKASTKVLCIKVDMFAIAVQRFSRVVLCNVIVCHVLCSSRTSSLSFFEARRTKKELCLDVGSLHFGLMVFVGAKEVSQSRGSFIGCEVCRFWEGLSSVETLRCIVEVRSDPASGYLSDREDSMPSAAQSVSFMGYFGRNRLVVIVLTWGAANVKESEKRAHRILQYIFIQSSPGLPDTSTR